MDPNKMDHPSSPPNRPKTFPQYRPKKHSLGCSLVPREKYTTKGSRRVCVSVVAQAQQPRSLGSRYCLSPPLQKTWAQARNKSPCRAYAHARHAPSWAQASMSKPNMLKLGRALRAQHAWVQAMHLDPFLTSNGPKPNTYQRFFNDLT